MTNPELAKPQPPQKVKAKDGQYSATLKSVLQGIALHRIAVSIVAYKSRKPQQKNDKDVSELHDFAGWMRDQFYEINTIMSNIHWLLAVRRSQRAAKPLPVPKSNFREMLFYTGCLSDQELQDFFYEDWNTFKKDIDRLHSRLNSISRLSIQLREDTVSAHESSNKELERLETETREGISWMLENCSKPQKQPSGPGDQARSMISGLAYMSFDYFLDMSIISQYIRMIHQFILSAVNPKLAYIRDRIPIGYNENNIPLVRELLGAELEEFKKTVIPVINFRADLPDFTTATSLLVWDLFTGQDTESSSFLSEKPSIPSDYEHDGHDQESRFGNYKQKDVRDEDFGPGGKYRGVCKLLVEFENAPGKCSHGTGWLLDETTVVTAGHNLYHAKKYGHATLVAVYLGYNFDGTNTEVRLATRVALHRGYYPDGHRIHDAALIKLANRFDSASTYKWMNCPNPAADLQISVVGYPYDENEKKRAGTHMMESSCKASFDFGTSVSGLIEYGLDTLGGNSGGPIFQVEGDKLTVIGVHTTGNQYRETNAGVPIGHRGFNLAAFQKALYHEDHAGDTSIETRVLFESMWQVKVPLTIDQAALQLNPQ